LQLTARMDTAPRYALVVSTSCPRGLTAESQGYTRKKLDDDQPPSSGAPETGA
jgi:hypothetical protein